MKRIISAFTAFLLILLCSCTKESDTRTQTGTDTGSGRQTQTQTSKEIPAAEDMFTERDKTETFDETSAVNILLSGDTATCDSGNVSVSGGNVTISKEGTYLVSGTLEKGSICVDALATAKIQIVLKGANITSSNSAPIYIKQADKVVLTLAEGSENSLTAGDSFEAKDGVNIDGALFSKDDLTVNGKGTLNIKSPAGHGIVVKDDFVLTSGTVNIVCASHGIDANDSVRVAKGSLTVEAGKDGVHAENTDDAALGFVYIEGGSFYITAEGDGISAGSLMNISGGEFDIVSGGGSENAEKQTSDFWGGMGGGGRLQNGMTKPTSAITDTDTSDDGSTSIKGLKSSGDMTVSGGTFKMDCADDGIHSNGSVTVTGGEFDIATGDDGFHADVTLTVTNGTIKITESYEGLEAVDIKLQGGDINLKASDDGLNAAGGTDSSGLGGFRGDEGFGGHGGGGMMGSGNGSIVISGGKIYINASGDGIDANGTLEITDGEVTVCGPTQGDTATLDYDKSATISGGTFIGTGASGMAQTFSDAKQGLISINAGSQSANTEITVKDKKGNTVITHTPELGFNIVIISSPDIKSGETYTVYVGSQSKEFTAS